MSNLLVFDHAKISRKHFAGDKTDWDRQGKEKNFRIIVNPDVYDIEALRAQGWKIEEYTPNGADWVQYSIKVKVAVGTSHKPVIRLFYPLSNKLVEYTEETMAAIDDITIESADCIIRLYKPADSDREYGTAWLNEFTGIVHESPFAERYANAIVSN